MSPLQKLMAHAGVSERLAIGAAILFAKDRPEEFKVQFGGYAYQILLQWAKEFEVPSCSQSSQ